MLSGLAPGHSFCTRVSLHPTKHDPHSLVNLDIVIGSDRAHGLRRDEDELTTDCPVGRLYLYNRELAVAAARRADLPSSSC